MKRDKAQNIVHYLQHPPLLGGTGSRLSSAYSGRSFNGIGGAFGSDALRSLFAYDETDLGDAF